MKPHGALQGLTGRRQGAGALSVLLAVAALACVTTKRDAASTEGPGPAYREAPALHHVAGAGFLLSENPPSAR